MEEKKEEKREKNTSCVGQRSNNDSGKKTRGATRGKTTPTFRRGGELLCLCQHSRTLREDQWDTKTVREKWGDLTQKEPHPSPKNVLVGEIAPLRDLESTLAFAA